MMAAIAITIAAASATWAQSEAPNPPVLNPQSIAQSLSQLDGSEVLDSIQQLLDSQSPAQPASESDGSEMLDPTQQLQQVSLDKLTLSAVVVATNPDDTSALLESGNRSFIVHKGSPIGPNGGYVKEITTREVIVAVPIIDSLGAKSLAETVLRMSAP